MIPVPLTVKEELVRIRQTRFLKNTLAVVPEVFYSELVYGAVHLAVPCYLVAYLTITVPLGTAHVDNIVNRLEHISVSRIRETKRCKLVHIGRVARCDHLTELVITCAVCIAVPYDDSIGIIAVGSFACFGNAVIASENLIFRSIFFIIPA